MMVISALKQVATAATNAVHSATSAGHSHSSTSGTLLTDVYIIPNDSTVLRNDEFPVWILLLKKPIIIKFLVDFFKFLCRIVRIFGLKASPNSVVDCWREIENTCRPVRLVWAYAIGGASERSLCEPEGAFIASLWDKSNGLIMFSGSQMRGFFIPRCCFIML